MSDLNGGISRYDLHQKTIEGIAEITAHMTKELSSVATSLDKIDETIREALVLVINRLCKLILIFGLAFSGVKGVGMWMEHSQQPAYGDQQLQRDLPRSDVRGDDGSASAREHSDIRRVRPGEDTPIFEERR